MNRRSVVVVLCLVGGSWSPEAARAAVVDAAGRRPSTEVAARQGRPAPRPTPELTDERTGVAMRLTRMRSGALQVDLDAGHLEVRKTLYPNGDSDLTLRAEGDWLTVLRRGGHVRVDRNDRSVGFAARSLGDSELDQLQAVLSGSTAVRRFRAMRGMLSPATRRTVLGVSVDIIDCLIGVLSGERPAPSAETAAPAMTARTASEGCAGGDGPTCFESWKQEVVAAWKDYEDCVNSFSWYNPMREVCAFEWVLRVESAWFKFLGCSCIPMKVE